MTFYTYAYIEQQAHYNTMLGYALLALVILGFIVTGYHIMRHRFDTRWRDLCLIFLLIMFFAGGIMVSNFESKESDVEASSRMGRFIEKFAEQEDIPTDEIFVSSLRPVSNMVLYAKGKYYSITFYGGANAYKAEEVTLSGPIDIVVESGS